MKIEKFSDLSIDDQIWKQWPQGERYQRGTISHILKTRGVIAIHIGNHHNEYFPLNMRIKDAYPDAVEIRYADLSDDGTEVIWQTVEIS